MPLLEAQLALQVETPFRPPPALPSPFLSSTCFGMHPPPPLLRPPPPQGSAGQPQAVLTDHPALTSPTLPPASPTHSLSISLSIYVSVYLCSALFVYWLLILFHVILSSPPPLSVTCHWHKNRERKTVVIVVFSLHPILYHSYSDSYTHTPHARAPSLV